MALSVTALADVVFSEYWGCTGDGKWHVYNESGTMLKNCWVCDDIVDQGNENWYYIDADGNALSSGVIVDENNRYYSLEPAANGLPGRLRKTTGTYEGIFMEISPDGAVTNPEAISALSARYAENGIVRAGNIRPVYTRNLAEETIQGSLEMPKSSELYHNPAYLSSSANFTINNAGTNHTYIKMYAENGDFVSGIFIRKGERVRIYLPGGVYRMRQAFGSRWYGEEQMFGSEGLYWQCTVNGKSELPLKRAGVYVISTSGNGEQISKQALDRHSF